MIEICDLGNVEAETLSSGVFGHLVDCILHLAIFTSLSPAQFLVDSCQECYRFEAFRIYHSPIRSADI